MASNHVLIIDQAKVRLPLLYSLKALCAFAVVALHSDFAYKIYLLPVLRLAVPIFFLINGYFWRVDKNKQTIWKILKLILVTNSVYLLFHLCDAWIRDSNYFEELLHIKFWIRQLLWGNKIEGVLWYLTTYAEVLLLLPLLLKFLNFNQLVGLSLFSLIVSVFFGVYGKVFGYHCFMLTGGGVTGLPAIVLGIWIRRNEEKLLSYRLLFLLIAFFILGYLEYYVIQSIVGFKLELGGDLFVTTLPLSVVLFLWVLKHKEKRIPVIEKIGESATTFIYCYHMLISYMLFNIIGFCNFYVLLPTCLICAAVYNKLNFSQYNK